ncbi:hypothetical protein [Enterococcus sp. DIV0170]|uniref:hypothetical protein n=1 Tax=Enterococcus sp. DIV0170 TaxID=2774642 RepID=UPI003F2286C0
MNKKIVKFFLGDDLEKYDKLLEILNSIDFDEIETEQHLIIKDTEPYQAHREKIIYYKNIPEQK